MASLLVLGAREHSLGEAVAEEARDNGFSVTTAGISREEDIYCDVTQEALVRKLMNGMLTGQWFDHVVCTVGVNRPDRIVDEPPWEMSTLFQANVFAPMLALHHWLRQADEEHEPRLFGPFMQGRHFVAISSNSAHVARSPSMSYCASKAALSMAIRCAARDIAWRGAQVYAYEFGWIDGTPMSHEATQGLSLGEGAMHRMPGGGPGLDRGDLAGIIVDGLSTMSGLNGCTLRIDGGEQ